MDMSAYFLACFSSSKNANYRNFGALGNLGRTYIVTKLRVVLGCRRLIVVDTVQSDPEQVHILQNSNPSEARR